MDQFPFDHFLNNSNNQVNEDNLKNKYSLNNNNLNINNNNLSNSNSENYENSPEAQSDLFNNEEIQEFHATFLNYLKNNISNELFESYFSKNFTINDVTHNKITFLSQNSVTKKIVEKACSEILDVVVRKVFGDHFTYEIQARENLSLNNNEDSSRHDSHKIEQNSFVRSSFKLDSNPSSLENQNDNSNENAIHFNFNKADTAKSHQKSFRLDNNKTNISKSSLIDDKIKTEVIKHSNKYSHIIDSNKTFENFIVGPSNNMAHAFAIAVAKNPGITYPSLFLHGNSGLGKTHLLHAICNKILHTHPRNRITFTSANGLMNDVIEFTQSNKRHELKKKYIDSTDILIIDDIHELEKRTGTQNEFFHIFNQLQAKKKQLIFTSDKHPKEIDGIEERIRTRLSSALIVEIEKPDFETRVAILKEKAFEHDILLDNEVIRFIATSIKSNIRELEGSLIKLGAYSKLMHKDIDIEIAKEQLKIENDFSENIMSIEKVTKIVTNYYKVTVGDIRGKSRLKKVTRARQIAMHLTYEFVSKETLESIGSFFGHRDHSTVLYSINNIQQVMKNDKDLAKEIYEIESSF